jgi:hypothetical protein
VAAQSALELFAREAISALDSQLEEEFATLIAFLEENPELARIPRGKNAPRLGSKAHVLVEANRFVLSREMRSPSVPTTVPDIAVSKVLEAYYGLDASELERVKREHQLSMAAEGFVGDLLERYIAANVRDHGWIWCSGESVRHVDFVRRGMDAGMPWETLQVKNRDNSENSSSSAIRAGTAIQKWHRSKSRTGETCWETFPAATSKPLTEDGFLAFVDSYFDRLRGFATP